MNWKSVVVGIVFVGLLFFGIPIRIERTPIDLEEQFNNFLQKFNKTYNNETVYQKRFEAFKNSLNVINKLNSNRTSNLSAFYGLTQYSDMMPHEFVGHHLQRSMSERISSRSSEQSNEQLNRIKRSVDNLSTKIDWRKKGVITKVNNQKLCGACWAFSTIENMEAMNAIKTGKLVELSVQQLLDCAGYDNEGCKGGDACSLQQWLQDYNVTVVTELEYPLHLQTETCKVNKNNKGVQIGQFACDSLVDNEEYILSTLAEVGPVAVAINAISWQNYIGGVIQFHCSSLSIMLNHAVQIVGYDLTAEIPHYIVRNSWGEEFGDKGYLYIAIGSNVCGLANEVSVLTVL